MLDGHRPSSVFAAEGGSVRAVEFHSLTKSFSMAGWRAGFVLGRADVVAALTKLKSYLGRESSGSTCARGTLRQRSATAGGFARGGLVVGRVLAEPVWRVVSVIRHAAVPAARSVSRVCSCSLLVTDPLLGRPCSRRGGR
jgi:hypothetical protein